MLRAAGCGFGFMGLQSLLAETAADHSPRSRRTFPARAKRVIFLFMHGGPSSIDYVRSKTVSRRQRREAAADQAAPYPLRPARPVVDEIPLAVQELRPEWDADQQSAAEHP